MDTLIYGDLKITGAPLLCGTSGTLLYSDEFWRSVPDSDSSYPIAGYGTKHTSTGDETLSKYTYLYAVYDHHPDWWEYLDVTCLAVCTAAEAAHTDVSKIRVVGKFGLDYSTDGGNTWTSYKTFLYDFGTFDFPYKEDGINCVAFHLVGTDVFSKSGCDLTDPVWAARYVRVNFDSIVVLKVSS